MRVQFPWKMAISEAIMKFSSDSMAQTRTNMANIDDLLANSPEAF